MVGSISFNHLKCKGSKEFGTSLEVLKYKRQNRKKQPISVIRNIIRFNKLSDRLGQCVMQSHFANIKTLDWANTTKILHKCSHHGDNSAEDCQRPHNRIRTKIIELWYQKVDLQIELDLVKFTCAKHGYSAVL